MMRKKIISKILFLGLLCIYVNTFGQTKANELIQKDVWSTQQVTAPHLKEGLAGSFFGKYNQFFIWAGGSSFPKEKPWEGGKKVFSQAVFVFDEQWKLVQQGDFLPQALAEGASVSTPHGILCVGGQSESDFSAKTFLVTYNGKVVIKNLPDFPKKHKAAAITSIKDEVFVIGGQLPTGESTSEVYHINLSEPAPEWKRMPDYPHAVSGAVAVAQQDGREVSLFVFGGRNKSKTERLTTFYSDVHQFSFLKERWEKRNSIQLDGKTLPLAMATGGKMGASSIVLLGGDTGETFAKVEQAILKENVEERNALWQNHQGFLPYALIYNTISDEWTQTSLTNPVAVSTSYSDGEKIYLVGGEKRPGVRADVVSVFDFQKKTSFGWVNYAVLVLYFVGMLYIGFFFMKRNNNTQDYFKGSGRIPWWAAGISIFATMLSAITFLSIPAKTYATDWKMLFFNMTIILAVPFVIRYFLPFFLKFNYDTAYQYLEARFNRRLRWIAAFLFVLFMVSRIAVVLYLPSIALNAVTGFNVYYSILIMSLVTIIYSSSGGMEAVVWGDVIQGVILIGGALLAFVVMMFGIEGGLNQFVSTAMEFDKFSTFDFTMGWKQPTFWVVLLGGFANTMVSYTSDQSVVQRYMTTTNAKATAKSIWLNGIISIPVSILFFLLGTGLFAFYKSHPDLLDISNPNIDSVFPQFIVSELPIGMAGLLIASIFAAAMSTISSNVNSVSAVVTSDFYKTLFPNSSFTQDMAVARWSGVIIGILGTAMAVVLATWNVASLWDQFNTFLGLLTSGLGALFILGIFFPRVSSKAAFIGLFGGIFILYMVKTFTSISFLLYGFIGVVACIFIAVLASLLLPNGKDISGLTWKDHTKK